MDGAHHPRASGARTWGPGPGGGGSKSPTSPRSRSSSHERSEPGPGPGEGPDPSRSRSPRAGGSRWTSFTDEGLGSTVEKAAYHYLEVVGQLTGKGALEWLAVKKAGDSLLLAAGTVERAATALWIARETLGWNNLAGVDDEDLDAMLHPDHLEYLREVCREGMPARYQGLRTRLPSKLHPRAQENVDQVYVQVMKDVLKHRVLVVDSEHPGLATTVSSPFETVPKMLPNRTLSKEVRLVHDQRRVNCGTDSQLASRHTSRLLDESYG